MDLLNKIFIYVIASVGIFLVYRILFNIGSFFKEGTKLKESENDKTKLDSSLEVRRITNEENDFSNNNENTIGILNICHSLIAIEVSRILEPCRRLNEKYEYRRLDDDAKTVSENVFNALNKEMIVNSKIILTNDYILQYIASESILVLMDTAQKYNVDLISQ